MPSTLSRLQERVLAILASTDVAWRLTGGGALAGYHLGHRTTEDLDLFLAGARRFDREPDIVLEALDRAGLDAEPVQRHPGFVRLMVRDGVEGVMVDLVADPVPLVEPPVRRPPGVLVDTPHEILVNKLTTLLSRAEIRDLEDVRQLLAAGEDLDRALVDAPAKDGGFSPVALAWVLESFSLRAAGDLGFDPALLDAFRLELIERLIGD